jgi:hypothetical protein
VGVRRVKRPDRSWQTPRPQALIQFRQQLALRALTVKAGRPVAVSSVVWNERLGGGPVPTAVIPTLVRVPEPTGLSPSRHISFHQSTPRRKHRVPRTIGMRTQVNDVSLHASGAAAFLIEIDSVSKIGPKSSLKG